MGVYTPSLAELRLTRGLGTSFSISRDILLDLDTPVSAYLKLRGDQPGVPSFLLESVEGGERIGRYSLLGVTPRGILRVKNGRQWLDGEPSRACRDPLSAVQELVAAYRTVARPQLPFRGGALGYLSYEAARSFERLPAARNDPLDLPDAAFMDVDTLLVFDHVTRRAQIVTHLWLDDELSVAYERAVERIETVIASLEAPLAPPNVPGIASGPVRSNMESSRFEEIVRRGKEYIRAGDILQVVLSHRLSLPLPGDPFGYYRRLRSVSPSPYMYFLDFGDHQVVGTSPELLLQAKDDVISTRPIAGTRRRGATQERDKAMAADLMSDDKERAEHLMLVDLARNDIGRVSLPGSVEVSNFMTIERFSHVMHLVTDVAGFLRPECTSYDALRAAFPAGTVSGAPKIRAMEIIAELEPDARGPYGGAVGFVSSGGDMEMAITIRTAVIQNGTLTVQVGAGIVADSIPEREYLETMNKARSLLVAAGVEA